MRRVLVALCLMGCWGTDARIAEGEEAVRDAMVVHHKEVLAARDAVIAGDHENATRALGALAARLPLKNVDPARQRNLESVVREGAEAQDLRGVARAVGKAGAACGTCHRAIGSKPPEEAGPKPIVSQEVKEQMKLHRWAMLTLWDGLVRGDTPAFANAAQALQATPMIPTGTPIGAPVPREAVALEIRVHDLAARAARVDSHLERGKVVGDLLHTCQQCHAVMNGGPAGPD